MTTLLAVYDGRGKCIGRCDAGCYAAHEDRAITHKLRCRCICGGVNHGKGRVIAVDNVSAGVGLAPADLARFAHDHDRAVNDLVVIDRIAVPDAREARTKAWLKLWQLELPFDTAANV